MFPNPLQQAREHAALVDEQLVESYLADITKLLTASEQEKMRELAGRGVRIQSEMAQIAVEAARRSATSPEEEVSARAAVGAFFAQLAFEQLREVADVEFSDTAFTVQ